MKYSICFDIGGTRIKLGVMSNAELMHHELVAIDDNSSLKTVLELIKEKVQVIQKMYEHDQLIAIGMSLPCFVDSDKNKILSNYVKYTDASDIDLNEWCLQNFGVPIFLENDAKAALMGEAFHGAGKGYQDLVMVTFGTGIGSAVMLNGQLLKGKDYFAGNLIGHSIIDFNGDQCNCGGEGCLESVASSWALTEKVENSAANIGLKDKPSKIDYKYIFDEEKMGNHAFAYILDESLDAWGKMMINLILAYNPECIVCAGGIMNQGEVILNSFRKTIDQHGWISSENVILKTAENTDFAALYGLSEIINQKIKRG
ncbi:ROK family protein [Portibacter lacus]|uniref:Glucokinase n=1 Tax=Portibacter lacus TaxID=1099794 RepID=A0AA37SW08_9BACT|nr:ROK family protein [Portibacter lacus]GLR18740.1 glucokinase [Portibacter lacus]